MKSTPIGTSQLQHPTLETRTSIGITKTTYQTSSCREARCQSQLGTRVQLHCISTAACSGHWHGPDATTPQGRTYLQRASSAITFVHGGNQLHAPPVETRNCPGIKWPTLYCIPELVLSSRNGEITSLQTDVIFYISISMLQSLRMYCGSFLGHFRSH